MKHWIRDLRITLAANTRGQGQIDYVLFHFLRTAGWAWLWECDGYAGDDPNRVPDGNMEAAGTGSYTALGGGASIAKVATPLRSGTQALQVVSSAANEGVETSVFTSMENVTQYHVSIWAYNNSGDAWDVDIDTGIGSYANLGTIPDNGGVWTLYHFSFTSAVSGSRKLRVVDANSTLDEVYISDIHVFRSYFEYNPADAWVGGSDGSTGGPDQFSSISYTFVTGDIGKVVCVWDTTNLGNSGAYKILSVAAGVATLDLRSGSAVLAPANNVDWRMIDLAAAPENVTGGDTAERGAGFGLQSPHASQHRLFMRQAQYGPTSPFIDVVAIWGAPGPTDFDFSTGTFYLTGASSQRNRQAPYTLVTSNTGPWANTHAFVQGDGDTSDDRRLFLMTDDDGSFVTIFGWETSGNNRNDTFIIGYLGTDVQHPGDEEWALFARWENWYPSAWRGSVDFDYENYRFTYAGTVIDPNGQAVDAEWLQYGIGGSTASIITQSNAGPNPWSGEEWLHNPIVSRDRFGASGVPSERDADIGVYQGRQNMVNLSTFDSDGYIHFQNGLVWEWPGVTVLP